MKTKKQNWYGFVLFLYNRIEILWSCCLCWFRALFNVSSSLNFFLNVFKSYWKAFKVRSFGMKLCCKMEFLCRQFFLFVKPGSKTGKSLCQQWFLSKLIWFIRCRFFIEVFYLSDKPGRFSMLFELLVLILLASLLL